MQVWYVSLLHVIWFVSLNKQWLTDTRQATACNARLKIVGLVLLSHVGDTGGYVYIVHEHDYRTLRQALKYSRVSHAYRFDFPPHL